MDIIYLRIDKLIIDKDETVQVVQGESAEFPAPPAEILMLWKLLKLLYLHICIQLKLNQLLCLKDNRRFTMRDIAALEKELKI